jgi:hypothetical protein
MSQSSALVYLILMTYHGSPRMASEIGGRVISHPGRLRRPIDHESEEFWALSVMSTWFVAVQLPSLIPPQGLLRQKVRTVGAASRDGSLRLGDVQGRWSDSPKRECLQRRDSVSIDAVSTAPVRRGSQYVLGHETCLGVAVDSMHLFPVRQGSWMETTAADRFTMSCRVQRVSRLW